MMRVTLPDFALSFSADAVHLLRRDAVSEDPFVWTDLGSASFTSTEFRSELAALRDAALAEGADGANRSMLDVVLIIPDDHILYASVSVPQTDPKKEALERALDGLTPYPIDELAFDWTGDGTDLRVAAVARQTLEEARDFALRHGFDGVTYSARPAPEDYSGMPDFRLEEEGDPAPEVAPAPVALREDEAAEPLGDYDLIPDSAEVEPTDVAYTEITRDDVADAAAAEEPAPEAAVEDDAAPDEVEDAKVEEVVEARLSDDTNLFVADPLAENAFPSTDAVTEAKPDPVAEDADARDDEPAEAEAEAEETVAVATVEDEPAEAAVAEPEAEAEDAADEAAPEPEASMGLSAADAPAEDYEDDERVEDDDDDTTEAERAAFAAAAAQVAAEEAAAAERAAEEATRHHEDDPQPDFSEIPPEGVAADVLPEETLNPRAKAVRAKAAEARRTKIQGAGTAAPRVDAEGRQSRVPALLAGVGAAAAVLILLWVFFAPTSNPARDAVRAAEEGRFQPEQGATTTETPAGQAAETASVEPAATTPTAPQPVETAPTAPDSALSPGEREIVRNVATQPAAAIIAQTAIARQVAQEAALAAQMKQTPPAQTATETPDQIAADAAETSAEPEIAATPVARTRPQTATPAPRAEATAPAANAAPKPSPNQQTATAPTREAPRRTPTTPARPAQTTEAPERATTPAATATRPRLTSSARPQRAPQERAAVPRRDTPPRVPDNPLPFEAAQRETVRPASVRPPQRRDAPATTQPTAATPEPAAATPAPTATSTQIRGSNRPPSRPQGSAPDTLGSAADLTGEEKAQLASVMADFRAYNLRRAGMPEIGRDPSFQTAEARPTRRPSKGGDAAVNASAVEAALKEAADPPAAKASTVPKGGAGGILASSRPQLRPGAAKANPTLPAAKSAVDDAVREAVNSSSASQGSVELSALRSSPLPPRRAVAKGAATAAASLEAAAETQVASLAPMSSSPTPPDAPAASPEAEPSGPSEADLAARRKLDEQLQSQAEARIRARAAADQAAEAQARAQAEARARAQVEAEERAAARKQQTYRPAEIDDEPEVALNTKRGGASSGKVAAAATQKRGINMGRTTIIGIIGAGKASRALIRLSSGRIVTVRLGDRIDGGTINSIGDGRITYVKGGQLRELRMLDGR